MENTHKFLEDFFRQLNFALRSTAVYSPSHPMFKKTIEAFMGVLADIQSSYPRIYFSVMPNGILFEDRVLTAENATLYKDMADFFHKKKIESIDINLTALTQAELEKFITILSQQSDEDIRRDIAATGFKALTIKVLDYSEALKEENGGGVKQEEMTWETRLKRFLTEKMNLEFKQATLQLLQSPGFSQEIKDALNAINQHFALNAQDSLPMLQELTQTIEKIFQTSMEGQANKEVLQALNKIVVTHAPAENVSQLLATLFSLQKTTAGMAISEYANAIDPAKQEEIARTTAHILKAQGILMKNPQLKEDLNQAIFNNPLNKFASLMYKYTLRYFTDTHNQKSIDFVQSHAESFQPPTLKKFVHEILCDLIQIAKVEKRLSHHETKVIYQHLKNSFTEYLRTQNLEGALTINTKVHSLLVDTPFQDDFQGTLSEYLKDAFDEILSTNLDQIYAFKDTLIPFIAQNLPEKIPAIGKCYFATSDSSQKNKLKECLVLCDHPLLLNQFTQQTGQMPLEEVLDIISIVGRMKSDAAQETLMQVYRMPWSAVKHAVLKEMKHNAGIRNRRFLLSLLEENHKDPVLLTETIDALRAENDSFINNKIASVLCETFSLNDILFNKNKLSERLRLIQDMKLKEAVPLLDRILTKYALLLVFFSHGKALIMKVITELR